MANLLFATRESDSLGSENPGMSQPSRGLVLPRQRRRIRTCSEPGQERPERKSPSRYGNRGGALCTEVGSVSVSPERDASSCPKRVKEAFTLHVSPGRPSRREMNR